MRCWLGNLCARSDVFAHLSKFLTVVVVLGGMSAQVSAAPWQFKPFLKSLEESPYNQVFIQKGLSSVSALKFKDDVVNQYQPFFNRIVLQKSMDDGANRIKPISTIDVVDLGVLAHESFHAFKANFIESDPKYARLKDWMANRSRNLYLGIPSVSKRAVAMEEAYAVFIGWSMTTRSSLSKILVQAKREGADCATSIDLAKRLWAVHWKSDVDGYYYNDGIIEYWTSKAEALRILVTKGKKAYRDYVDQDETIFINDKLQPLDKKWISENIFNGSMKESFEETFAKSLQELNCSTSPIQAP